MTSAELSSFSSFSSSSSSSSRRLLSLHQKKKRISRERIKRNNKIIIETSSSLNVNFNDNREGFSNEKYSEDVERKYNYDNTYNMRRKDFYSDVKDDVSRMKKSDDDFDENNTNNNNNKNIRTSK